MNKLEAFKFSIYVFIPILAVGYFQNPKVFRAIIKQKSYIRYPAENELRPEDLLPSSVISSNSFSSNSTPSKEASTTPKTNPENLKPRRYILFGPRDDPEALKAKRGRTKE